MERMWRVWRQQGKIKFYFVNVIGLTNGIAVCINEMEIIKAASEFGDSVAE